MKRIRESTSMRFYGLDKHRRFSEAARYAKPTKSIVDVGGGMGDFFDFIGCSGVVADLPPNISLQGRVETPHSYVVFDGQNLPFRERAFDVVVSLDTLEHIPRDRRVHFLRSLQGLSADRIVLAFPQRHSFLWVLLAISDIYDRLRLSPMMKKSLGEHIRYGLPSKEEAFAAIDDSEWKTEHSQFFGRFATALWIIQLVLPLLAFNRFNRLAGRLFAMIRETGSSECLIHLQRRESRNRS